MNCPINVSLIAGYHWIRSMCWSMCTNNSLFYYQYYKYPLNQKISTIMLHQYVAKHIMMCHIYISMCIIICQIYTTLILWSWFILSILLPGSWFDSWWIWLPIILVLIFLPILLKPLLWLLLLLLFESSIEGYLRTLLSFYLYIFCIIVKYILYLKCRFFVWFYACLNC